MHFNRNSKCGPERSSQKDLYRAPSDHRRGGHEIIRQACLESGLMDAGKEVEIWGKSLSHFFLIVLRKIK